MLTLSGIVNAATVTYAIGTIGPIDTEHTRSSDNYRLSEAQHLNSIGQVVGFADRYDAASVSIGRTTWLYDGASTINIGLTDSEHTRNTDNYRYSLAQNLNDAGQVSGYSRRYDSSGSSLGRSAWLFNGTATVNIGFTDSVHTRDTDTYRFSSAQFMNEVGSVAGYSNRYKTGGESLGLSTWLYNGTATVNIGLTDAEHTGDDNKRHSSAEAMNESGQVLGYANRYSASGTDLGRSAWIFDGTSTSNISLTDTEHTRSSDNYRYSSAQLLNDAGQAVGFANRYAADMTNIGTSTWLYNGTTTTNISLSDADHTRSTDNYRFSSARKLNSIGNAAGYAERFDASGNSIGRSAWLYNGSSTIQIGLTDAEHTRETDGYRFADVQQLNNIQTTIGYSKRYAAGGAAAGRSAWLYNGSDTVQIGLAGAEHTRLTDNYKYSSAQYLGQSGNAIGYSERYGASGDSLGRSAWLFNGSVTANIGLTDAAHTRSTDDYRFSYAQFMNASDEAAGYAYRYNASGAFTGQSAWLFDGTFTVALDPLSIRSDGYTYSAINFLGDDGLLLGSYTLFDASDTNMGSRAFWYMEDIGIFDLGMLVDESFTAQDWDLLATSVSSNMEQLIIGGGLLADMSSGSVAYLLTPQIVPVPPALWLFGSALAFLGWHKRRNNI